MRTEDLIARLAGGLAPVRRLPAPPVLLAIWIAFAAGIIALAVLLIGVRSDPATPAMDRFETAHLLGAGLTALLAGLAAFELALPDRDRRWGWLPLPGIVLWFGTMGLGCLGELLGGRLDGFWVSWSCMAFILGIGLPLSLAMLWLTRHAAWISPGPVAAYGALSAAAFASIGLTLVHPTYGPTMVLAWHGLAVLGLAGLIGRIGPRLQRRAA